jgi:SulP family sulfate permease
MFLAIMLAIAFLTIGDFLKLIPMAALAGLLVVIGFEMIKPQRLARVRGTHWSERLAMVLTFVLTLTIPIQYAILAGVASTVCVYIYSSSVQIRIFEVVPLADGRYEERPAPTEIPSNKTTILGVYGNAFFAAVYTLERNLPSLDRTRNAVIVLSMRGRDVTMTSFLAFLERYAKKLQAGRNRLVLCGVEPGVKAELEKSGMMRVLGEGNIFTTTSILGDSIGKARAAADEWLKETR